MGIQEERMRTSAMQPILVHEAVVAMDYHQLVFSGRDHGTEGVDLAALLDQAYAGQRIAGQGDVLLILSPHQSNFAMPLRIELWQQPPPADLDGWQEVFEAPLDITDAGLTYESPTMTDRWWNVPEGHYVARISGRGFVAHAWTGSGESWLVQLWPGTAEVEPRRLRAWTPPPAGG
jgi:hypothetical protein